MKNCLRCGNKNGTQQYNHDHPEHYDGVSEFVCLSCGYRVGRWTGRELNGNDYENRYGRE